MAAKKKAKPVPKKAPVKPSKRVAKAAPAKAKKVPPPAPKKKAPVVPKQMTGKPRAAKKGDNGGPQDDLELDFENAPKGVKVTEDKLEAIREKGRELYRLNVKVEELTSLLAETTKQKNEVEMHELPTMLQEVQLDGITLANGYAIEMTEKLIGTLPKEEGPRQKAFDVIEERGGGDIIKSLVTVGFAKSELEMAKELVEELKERDMPAEVKVDIHHQTLLKFAKDYLEDEDNKDDPLPLADLGLSYISYVRLKEPKGAKKTNKVV